MIFRLVVYYFDVSLLFQVAEDLIRRMEVDVSVFVPCKLSQHFLTLLPVWCFFLSVSLEKTNSAWVWLIFCWAFAKFSWQRKNILTKQVDPWQAIKNVCSKDLWNGTLVRYICSKDLHSGTLCANWKSSQKRINLSNRSKSTGSLKSSPNFWTRHLKRSVKPGQSWLTWTTDGNMKSWKCRRRRLL